MTKVNIGDVVRVEFWDHADGNKPAIIEAFGRVGSLDLVSLYLIGWQPAICKDEFESEAGWSILRCTILSLTVYDRATPS